MCRGLALVVVCGLLAATGCRDIAGYPASSPPLEVDRGVPRDDAALDAQSRPDAPLDGWEDELGAPWADQAPPYADQSAAPDEGPAPPDKGPPTPDLVSPTPDTGVPRDAPAADTNAPADKGAPAADKGQPRDRGALNVDLKAADILPPPPLDCSLPANWTCVQPTKFCEATCLPHYSISCNGTACTCFRDGSPVRSCTGALSACGMCISMQTIAYCCAM